MVVKDQHAGFQWLFSIKFKEQLCTVELRQAANVSVNSVCLKAATGYSSLSSIYSVPSSVGIHHLHSTKFPAFEFEHSPPKPKVTSSWPNKYSSFSVIPENSKTSFLGCLENLRFVRITKTVCPDFCETTSVLVLILKYRSKTIVKNLSISLQIKF